MHSLSYLFVMKTLFGAIAASAALLVDTALAEDSVVMSLPNGFSPDGITISGQGTVYVVSIFDGAIVRGNVEETEIASVLVEGKDGRPGWGMDLDATDTLLFVAGGFAGTARIYDTETGALIEELSLATGGIVNDVIVADDAAYFTNSSLPELYEVAINAENGNARESRVIPLTGDFEYGADFFANANGIDYLGDGKVVVNHSFFGKMYVVDLDTGVATEMGLGEEKVSADGITLDGNTLFAVEAVDDRLAELEVSDNLEKATLVRRISSKHFDFPTIIAAHDEHIFVVNGKLSTERGPEVPYEVIRLSR